MAAIRELSDILVLVEQLPDEWQRKAVKALLQVLYANEGDVSEAHLTGRERRELNIDRHLEWMARKGWTFRRLVS